ncbi:hypothetical protein Tco_0698497 [Tanacetum coccineum]
MERDRAMGGVVEGFGDAIRNMENGKNVESGGENIGEYFVSLSDDEADDVQTTQIAPDIFNARNMAGKQKNTCYNANFANIANDMTDDNQRQKVASEKLKDVLAKLVKLNIPTVDVLDAADIFSTNKEKMDVFLNLPHELRITYIMKLTSFGLSEILDVHPGCGIRLFRRLFFGCRFRDSSHNGGCISHCAHFPESNS